MRANDVRATDAVRHGAYVAFRLRPDDAAARAGAAVAALAARLGLVNEFDARGGDPPSAVAFLRRVAAVAGARDDEGLRQADAVVHVAAPTAAPVAEFCAELSRLVGPAAAPRVLGGVVRPMTYTGNAMHNFAYAHRVLQQPGRVMPNAFLIPMSKTPEWWAKDWMERHTYFLPRYESGPDGQRGPCPRGRRRRAVSPPPDLQAPDGARARRMRTTS